MSKIERNRCQPPYEPWPDREPSLIDEQHVVNISCQECGKLLCRLTLDERGIIDFIEEWDAEVFREGSYGNTLQIKVCSDCDERIEKDAKEDPSIVEDREDDIRARARDNGFAEGYKVRQRLYEEREKAMEEWYENQAAEHWEQVYDKAERITLYLIRRLNMLEDQMEELAERVKDPDLMVASRKRMLKPDWLKHYREQASTEMNATLRDVQRFRSRLKIRMADNRVACQNRSENGTP